MMIGNETTLPERAVTRSESVWMRVLRSLHKDSVAWSLRRLHCPVEKDALVLEVGSGGNPYIRSNVLCDAYLDTRERHYAPLICDRPTCLAYVEKLPFKNDTFDFVIASHVLEHSASPEQFLYELQRVAKAGYIEVPDAFMERLTCYLDHRLEITDEDGILLIRKKHDHVQEKEVRHLFTNKASTIFPKWVAKFPFHFHVRYYWERKSGGIRYRILNPQYQIDWSPPELEVEGKQSRTVGGLIKHLILVLIRKVLSQNKRNKKMEILDLCRCVGCGGEELKSAADRVVCSTCGREFAITRGLIDFTKWTMK